MARKRYTTEPIIAKRREAEVALAQGDPVATVVRQLGVAEQTSTRGRREYGGLQVDQAKRRKELEQENQRRRRVVADQALDNAILKEVASGNFSARRTDVRQSATCRLPSLSQSVGRVASCAKPGARNAIRPARPRMRLPWWRAASPWRRASDATAPVASRRLWLADGTTPRRRAPRPNHVWSYDFVPDRTHDGRSRRLLCVVDEDTRACLAIVAAPRLRADGVLACLTQLFVAPGPPTYLRSDHGPAFTAHAVRSWLPRVGVTTRFIQPGSPWENGSVESCNGKLRDACRNGETFPTLAEAKVLIARWRRAYNEQRPHSALGSRPPRSPHDRGAPGSRPPGAATHDCPHFERGTTLGAGHRGESKPWAPERGWSFGPIQGPPQRPAAGGHRPEAPIRQIGRSRNTNEILRHQSHETASSGLEMGG